MKTTTRTWTRRGGRSHIGPFSFVAVFDFRFLLALSRQTIARSFFFFRESRRNSSGDLVDYQPPRGSISSFANLQISLYFHLISRPVDRKSGKIEDSEKLLDRLLRFVYIRVVRLHSRCSFTFPSRGNGRLELQMKTNRVGERLCSLKRHFLSARSHWSKIVLRRSHVWSRVKLSDGSRSGDRSLVIGSIIGEYFFRKCDKDRIYKAEDLITVQRIAHIEKWTKCLVIAKICSYPPFFSFCSNSNHNNDYNNNIYIYFFFFISLLFRRIATIYRLSWSSSQKNSVRSLLRSSWRSQSLSRNFCFFFFSF